MRRVVGPSRRAQPPRSSSKQSLFAFPCTAFDRAGGPLPHRTDFKSKGQIKIGASGVRELAATLGGRRRAQPCARGGLGALARVAGAVELAIPVERQAERV